MVKPPKSISTSEMISNVIGNKSKMGIGTKIGIATPLPVDIPRLEDPNHVKWMYKRISRSIIEFEKELDDTKEVGARLVSFNANETILIDDLGYWGPDLIKFYGTNKDGNKVELMQHTSQVNVLLVAVPVEGEKPNRIGFLLEQKLNKEED